MRACDPHARAVHADAPAGCCFLREAVSIIFDGSILLARFGISSKDGTKCQKMDEMPIRPLLNTDGRPPRRSEIVSPFGEMQSRDMAMTPDRGRFSRGKSEMQSREPTCKSVVGVTVGRGRFCASPRERSPVLALALKLHGSDVPFPRMVGRVVLHGISSDVRPNCVTD